MQKHKRFGTMKKRGAECVSEFRNIGLLRSDYAAFIAYFSGHGFVVATKNTTISETSISAS